MSREKKKKESLISITHINCPRFDHIYLTKRDYRLGYLKDNNAAAHSVDTGIT